MSDKAIFKIGGVLMLLSGALGLFYLLVSVMGAFEQAVIPSFEALIALRGVALARDIVLVLSAFFGSLGFIFAGLMFMRLPQLLVAGTKNQELHERMNRLQKVVYNLLQHVKSGKHTAPAKK